MLLKRPLSQLLSIKDFLDSQPGKSLAKNPLKFIDIGARGGVHDIVLPIAPYTSVMGFEPDVAECNRINAEHKNIKQWANMQLFPVALADKEGEQTLYMLSSNTNDSLLPPNEIFTKRYVMDKWRVIKTERLKTATLDKTLQEHNIHDHGEFIKLDTQGTEYEILQGATNLLQNNTVAVMTEVAFCELYKGQKLFSEVEILLRKHGFVFYGFGMMHRRSKKLLDKKDHLTAERMIYADAIFFKDPLNSDYITSHVTERQIYVLFILALLMGYFDYAQELAEQTWLQSSSVDEKNRIYNLVRKLSYYPYENSLNAVRELYQKIEKMPVNANINVGHFVDARRSYCDYDDVFNVSPLPEFYTE